jgi:hypothetical protein
MISVKHDVLSSYDAAFKSVFKTNQRAGEFVAREFVASGKIQLKIQFQALPTIPWLEHITGKVT